MTQDTQELMRLKKRIVDSLNREDLSTTTKSALRSVLKSVEQDILRFNIPLSTGKCQADSATFKRR
jgi:hypothetical protein